MTSNKLKKILFALVFLFSLNTFANSLVKEVAEEYRNLITWEDVQMNGDTNKIRLADADSLSSEVIDTLELLGLFINLSFLELGMLHRVMAY